MKKRSLLVSLITCMAVMSVPVFVHAAESEEEASLAEQAVALIEAEDYDDALALIQEGVEQGDPVAQTLLGECYYNGYGVEQDYEEAAKYYLLAADQEYPAAMFAAGTCCYLGNGSEVDMDEAFDWYQKALDAGYEPDQEEMENVIGLLEDKLKGITSEDLGEFIHKIGTEAFEAEDYKTAHAYWELEANLGYPKGLYNLGIMYQNGDGVEQDFDKAADYFEQAAQLGFEKPLDLEETFPSWDPDSAALAELIDFVNECKDESSPNYLEPEDRIAVFDMDGTILCEKAPVYIDYCLTMHRVLDDPGYNATEEERNSMEQIREHAYTKGETFHPESGPTKADLVASAFAGMTPEEFRSYVVDFADNTDAIGFKGMTYGESFYLPMIEVINYLRDNDFDVWMVSACEREVVRALVERFEIPFDRVIATDVPYVASGKDKDVPADDYNMSRDEEMLLGAPLDPVECGKSGKPAAIVREIGKRPVLAFGNSSGDYSMLNYAEGNPNHEGMGFFVVCDDTEREYGNDEKAADFYETVEKEGWTAISMADDWATIYGEGVEKTGLPGVEKKEAAADKAA